MFECLQPHCDGLIRLEARLVLNLGIKTHMIPDFIMIPDYIILLLTFYCHMNH